MSALPQDPHFVPREPGSYALLLRCNRPRRVRVGALGVCALAPGGYLYLGSALGPGGLAARLGHHAARRGVRHWHLDYIRPHLTLDRAWYAFAAESLEHAWARALNRSPGIRAPFARFGASDCHCSSHLFYADDPDCAEDFGRALALGPPVLRLDCAEAPALRRLARSRDAVPYPKMRRYDPRHIRSKQSTRSSNPPHS